MLPVVFIASSTEGRHVADSIQQILADRGIAEPVIWDQNVFHVSEYSLDSLLEQALKSDFAIIVLTADDKVESRGEQFLQPRDNVLFEMGLFLGVLGPKRVYIVRPRYPSIKILSDFQGLTLGTYAPDLSNKVAALGSFVAKVSDKINALGSAPKLPNRQSDLFIEKKIFSVKILNAHGDASLQQEVRLRVRESTISEREHYVYSNNDPSSWEELNLTAWDEKGRRLAIEKTVDDRMRKGFKVIFQSNLKKNSYFTYYYSCNWKGIFPPESSYLSVKTNTRDLEFRLSLPRQWELAYIKAYESGSDEKQYEIDVSPLGGPKADSDEFITYSYEINEFYPIGSEIKVLWSWRS